MQEQGPKKEREATVEGVLDAYREGDAMEARRLWDEWEQLKIRENDGMPESVKRLEVAVESLGFHVAAGQDPDVLAFEHFTVADAIGSDSTLTEDRRSALMKRLGEVMGDKL